jgi:hypothetical protein
VRIRSLALAGLAAASLVVGLAAPASAATNMSARQVAARLTPLGCRPRPSTATTIGIRPTVQLTCTIRGESIGIDQYRTAAQAGLAISFAQGVGCQIAKGFGAGSTFPFVYGPTWTVSVRTASTARAISRAIGNGARVAVIHC